VGLLRTLIEKLETTGAVAAPIVDEPDAPPTTLAAAQAAIDEAIRQRQLDERRAADGGDPRVVTSATYTGPERRASDRRRSGFGRRSRD